MDEYQDLLDTGGTCLSEDGKRELRCSSSADRLARSGVYEIKEWLRLDRRYTEFELFRSRISSENTWTAADAYEQIAFKNFTCFYEQCPRCTSACTIKWVQTATNIVRCTVGSNFMSQVACGFQSDAGQALYAMHGAKRSENIKGNPERTHAEFFRSCVDNKNGTIARDAVSCRRRTRASSNGEFVPGFDNDGNKIARRGYMVSCAKDADCQRRCPVEHPLHGTPYVCMKSYHLYDVLHTREDGAYFQQLEDSNTFDPDPFEQAITGEWGLCVVRLF